ncbi:uncharacterized protein EDB91DRAFT_1282701 [Suillus paluster]|uniref:uncharacterized protein n=1 Tax=Suillus paluster TaxID=48578 RepID=UPI001B85B8E3|nr:uncharacterized protein EDB91DRAFT_1282701 [Suillus paluster]KAG1740542.1 hypothetical protein EDB91DRAFT_1282701 [Suillus paluster]
MPVTNSTADQYVRAAQKPQRSYYKGTYPISKMDKVKLDLWMSGQFKSLPEPASNEAEEMGVVPSFPYKDVPIYGDTADILALNYHGVWGCLLTPENVSELAETTGIRYHAWVAAKQVLEEFPQGLAETFYVKHALRYFLFRLGLAMLDSFPGPVVTFIDSRFYESKAAMVDEARALVSLFDAADVRRWRVIITLPATEEGIRAAHELTNKYSICIHLSMVTSLAHACACIEAGASMLSMNVGPIMQWFEKKDGDEVDHPIAPGHPGIKTIQSCIDYIRQHSLNTSLLAVDIRNWSELKQLNGVDAAALDQMQLDQIPMHALTTWLPDLMEDHEFSPAYQSACEAKYPSHFLSHERGIAMALSAEDRSLMSSVVYIRLGQNKVFMEQIEDVIKKEVRDRLRLDTFDLHPTLYRRKRKELFVDEDANKMRCDRSSSKKPISETPVDLEGCGKGGPKENSVTYALIQACRLLGTLS